MLEDAAQAHALHFVFQLGVEGVHIDRQAAFAPQVVPSVLVARGDVFFGEAQFVGQQVCEALGVFGGVVGGVALVREQRRVLPSTLAVGTPVDAECPAWQLLAGVPLALAKVQKAALAVLVTQFLNQLGGQAALGGAQGFGVPFGAVAVVSGDKCRLAAHGQSHVACHQFFVHGFAQGHHLGPLRIGVGQGNAGGFKNSGHRHVVAERHLALVHAAFNRGCTRGLRRAGQRDVAFTGHQARGGVQADPACAGQVDLAPRVQVGEIDFCTAGTVERFDIRFQLNQVAGHEARCQSQMAEQLHHQPARIAARAGFERQRFLRRLHTRLHADQVADIALQHLVQVDQEVDGALLGQVDLLQVGGHQRRDRVGTK